MIEDYNNLHMQPIKLKKDIKGSCFKTGMCGLCTSSIQMADDDFVVAIQFHKSVELCCQWITFHFSSEEDYKDFCTNIIGLLEDDHPYRVEIIDEQIRLTNTMEEFGKRVDTEHK